MALILLIETSTSSCSVALADSGEIIACKELDERNIHAASITLFIEEVLKSSGRSIEQLDAVAVSKGPGSYTGLRIGVSTAKGICFALDRPLIAVDTLHAMAAGFKSENTSMSVNYYCPMIDARRMEVYTAVYDENLEEIQPVEAKIIDAASFADLLAVGRVVFFGDGAMKCADVLAGSNAIIEGCFFNSARYLASLAEQRFKAGMFEDLAYFEPFYLKDFLVLKPKAS